MLDDIERYRPGMTRQLAALKAALRGHMPRRGWKIGINVPEVLGSLGLHHPCLGWLDGHRLYRDGDRVELMEGQRLRAEAELCLLLAGPVAPELSADDALRQIASVAPAVEFVDYALPVADLDAIVASSALHAGFVVGAWQPLELASRMGPRLPRLSVTGQASPPPRSDLVPSHLGELVLFAARFLDAYGWKLEPGDLLLSGSFSAEAVPLSPGSCVSADFGLLGSANARVAAAS